MSETETTFGAWLRRQRLQVDLTQLELGQQVGCSVVTIRKLERDELRPSKQLAERLLHCLNVAPAHQAALLAFARGIGLSPQLDATIAPPAPIAPPQAVDLRLRHHNLSAPITPLVGRTAELAELERLFERPDVRLVTILGAGGMGKTHLAQEMARRHLTRTQESVFFVALAPLAAAEGLTTAIMDALGYPLQHDGRAPEQQLLDYLQQKQMLLVLDNFEHLLTGVGLVNAILRVAPGVKILVTSRERLLLSGETLYVLSGLAYPRETTAADLLAYDAIRLFVEHARHIRPTFVLSPADYPALVRICRLVEGMPLGILLAAAWVNVLSLTAIADEISQSLDFLETEFRDLPERHRSIRAAFAHSWRRLTEAERTVFMRLAVFRGGFTRQAAQSVTGASLHQLRALVNQSLLQVEHEERYTLHELLCQYAMAELTTAQQSEETFGRHCAYYLDLLAQCAGDLKGPHQAAVLTTIEASHEDVRAAWMWAVAHGDSTRIASALESLGFFYEWRGRFQEGERLFAQAATTFAQSKASDAQPILPRLLTWQATFQQLLDHQDQATHLLHRALAHIDAAQWTDHTAQLERAAILHSLGQLDYQRGNRLASSRLFAQSLAFYRACNDRWGEAKVLLSLSQPEPDNPQPQQEAMEARKAKALASLAIFRESGDQAQLAAALDTLGVIYLILGQVPQAQSALAECLTIHHKLGAVNGSFINAIGHMCLAQEYLGLYAQMYTQAQQALVVAQAVSVVDRIRWVYALLSSAALAQQRYDEVQHWFQEDTRLIQMHQCKTGPFIQQLVNWGMTNYRWGNLRQAQALMAEALRAGQAIGSIGGVVHGLLLGALLLVEQSKPALAIELHALAMSYPFVANSRWCEDVAGRDLVAVAASLPAEVVATARARGQAGDLWVTTAALLAELEQM